MLKKEFPFLIPGKLYKLKVNNNIFKIDDNKASFSLLKDDIIMYIDHKKPKHFDATFQIWILHKNQMGYIQASISAAYHAYEATFEEIK